MGSEVISQSLEVSFVVVGPRHLLILMYERTLTQLKQVKIIKWSLK